MPIATDSSSVDRLCCTENAAMAVAPAVPITRVLRLMMATERAATRAPAGSPIRKICPGRLPTISRGRRWNRRYFLRK